MGPDLSNSHANGFARALWRTTTSALLSERARHYRFAAAMTDCMHDVDMFSELAAMFDRLAHDFRRFEIEKRRALSATNDRSSADAPGRALSAMHLRSA